MSPNTVRAYREALGLAPASWAATSAPEEVQAMLAADPFRSLTLPRG